MSHKREIISYVASSHDLPVLPLWKLHVGLHLTFPLLRFLFSLLIIDILCLLRARLVNLQNMKLVV